jgi:hypothetical protein
MRDWGSRQRNAGTTLLAVSGHGNPEGTPFITLQGHGAGVEGPLHINSCNLQRNHLNISYTKP